jgi:hypothetical protein
LSGRKTKLNKELTSEIIKRIRAGNYIKVACVAVGISQTAYFDWIKKGEDGISPYAEFLGAIKKAEAEAHVNYVAIIASQASTQWQAAAWWLERKFPSQWAKREKIEISQEQVPSKEVETIEARFSHLSPKELNKYVNELGQKMLYGGKGSGKNKTTKGNN